MAFADIGHADEADGELVVFEFVEKGVGGELFVEGDAGDADDVGEDAGGGDLGACAGAFDHEWAVVVMVCGEGDDVVGAVEVVEGVVFVDGLE